MNNQTSTETIRSTAEFQKLFQRAKYLQFLIVALEVTLFIIVWLIPPIKIVGNWAFGVYAQFYWGFLIVPLIPVLDIIALRQYKQFAYRVALRFTFITLLMLLIGTLVFVVLGWTNFCCTEEGANLGHSVYYLAYLIIFFISYLPKILQAWSLMLLSNKIVVQQKSRPTGINGIQTKE